MAELKYQNPAVVDAQLESARTATGAADGTPEVRQEVVKLGEDLPVGVGRNDWQLQMLDELRAIRLGIQILLEYVNPLSGVSLETTGGSSVRVPTARASSLGSNEADLLELSQSIRSEDI